VRVREGSRDDVAAIRAVARSVGQDHEWAAGDERYLCHLLDHGRLVVGEDPRGVIGYAATRPIERAGGRISMLADLFVAPDAHGRGCGRALLTTLWSGEPVRMTFSSLHPSALPLYASLGLVARWPLLYLSGEASGLATGDGWAVEECTPVDAAQLEEAWSGMPRIDDYVAWAGRPGGHAFSVRRDRGPLAMGAVARPGDRTGWVLEHLAVAPGLDDTAAAGVVVAALAALTPAATVHLPAPHPAVRHLLAARWRVSTYDLFMATHDDLIDPERAVPSPALA
jgi:GNAT superfamily N-acetyltransferase